MLIEMKKLSKYYQYQKENSTCALNEIDLQIEAGEMVAIMGTSGAGKSTLLHVIAGLLSFEQGSYLFKGESVEEFSTGRSCQMRNEEIGVVFQNFALIEDYSVLINTMVPTYFLRGKHGKKKAAAEAALGKVGILKLKNKTPKHISGGEKQRCAIARAIVNQPALLLADEPTGQLDSRTAGEIMTLFRTLNQDGVTVIIVTHDSGVASLCDRIITMSDGRIVSDTASQ